MQKPPLYLHVTSTTKDGLEKAVAKINDLMKVDLPNLVDERRFRRPRQEQEVERDEFGRVRFMPSGRSVDVFANQHSANGLKRNCRLTSNQFHTSIYVRTLSALRART